MADYNVTVGKVSGENITLCNSFSTKDPSLTLILSYSAYNISVRALNSVGSSPVSSIAIKQMDELKGTLLSYFVTCYMQSTLVSFTLCPMSKHCIFEHLMRYYLRFFFFF